MVAILKAAEKGRWYDQLGTRIACVISNRPDTTGLALAAEFGVATQVIDHKLFSSRELFDAALQNAIDAHQPALVVLAGFMRILGPAFVQHFTGRLINIHPSLLPAFAGLNTHQRAIDAGCTLAGASVHLVTSQLDHGRVIAQAAVPVLPHDTAAALAARVLKQEHVIYPKAIRALLEGMC